MKYSYGAEAGADNSTLLYRSLLFVIEKGLFFWEGFSFSFVLTECLLYSLMVKQIHDVESLFFQREHLINYIYYS